jgi:hypothetical protein
MENRDILIGAGVVTSVGLLAYGATALPSIFTGLIRESVLLPINAVKEVSKVLGEELFGFSSEIEPDYRKQAVETNINVIGTPAYIAHQFVLVMGEDLECYNKHYTSINSCLWLNSTELRNLGIAHLNMHTSEEEKIKILRAYYTLTKRDLVADIQTYHKNALLRQ